MVVSRIPVIALTGYLGAGKTSVLNHLLSAPGARVGVVINDFGDINVDAALVSGQIDKPASIAGGCLCCLPDGGRLDEALDTLSAPRLGLDAIVVEASGIAEPAALARLIHVSREPRIRPGGVIEVIDAAAWFDTVDTGRLPPVRLEIASLVVVNKVDRLPLSRREATLGRIEGRIRARNTYAPIMRTSEGRIDPALVFDARAREDPDDQLPLAAAARDGHPHHEHADAVTVAATGPADAGRLIELLEGPPAGVYRLKGSLTLRTGEGTGRYVADVVGRDVHVSEAAHRTGDEGLVAIGPHLDTDAVRERVASALAPAEAPDPDGVRRLEHYLRWYD